MADLTPVEKRKLEVALEMGGGYVLDFSDRTFAEFFLDAAGVNIDDPRYGGASKAKRLRAFWTKEPNHLVGCVLGELLAYRRTLPGALLAPELEQTWAQVVDRLRQGLPLEDLNAVVPASASQEFALLARSVRSAIDQNEPQVGLDRLHTFVVKYFRMLCEKRGISTERGKALHGLVGEYAKALKAAGQIESDMAERILKSSISIFEAFNYVRNNQTMAHDNPVLNHDESLLIFGYVTSTVHFVSALEARIDGATGPAPADPLADEIPF